MVNTSRRWKIDYKNSSGSREIIAETGQDTGALKIDRHVHIRRKNDPDMLKVWLDGTDFSAIPTKKTEFGLASNGRDEQEILLKHYNEDTSSFDTVNRFYPKNKGTVDENGNLAWKLYSHMKSTAQETVPSVNNSNDIESALNDVLPSDYDATVPSGASVPSVDNYKLSTNGQTDREKGYHELTRNYGYAMTFTSNINGSGNTEVKYEPEGFGGTVDTLVPNEQATTHAIVDVDTGSDTFFVSGDITDSFAVNQSIEVVRSTGNDDTYTIDSLSYDSGENETDIDVKENVGNSTADGLIIPGGQAVFKSWEKEKADEVINKVRVEGTDSNGETVTGKAKNQAQIDNFGERFKKVKVGYVESNSEADEIAKNFLKPGKDDSGNDITEVPESGTVRTTVYTDNVVNDSFQIVDNTRDIDDTFTVVEQRNHWPEAISIIEFEFEKENLERAAIDKENLRDERARLYPDDQTDVGGQDIDQSQSNTTTAQSDISTSEDSQSPAVNGDSGFDNAAGQYNFDEIGATVTDGFSITASVNAGFVGSNGTQLFLACANFSFNGSAGDVDVEIFNSDSNTTYFNETFNLVQDNTARTVTILQEDFIDNEDIECTVTNDTGSAAEIAVDLTVDQIEAHQHDEGDYESDSHVHNTTANDAGHGDTTDSSTHELQGKTETGQNINTATEDKTDR